MELKPGYKQTEVGVIPEEWEATKVQNASTNITVGFVGSMAHLFVSEGVPLLRGQNILPQDLDLTNLKFISKETHQLWKKSALLPNDVAIVRVGYPGTACSIPDGLGDLNAASLVLVRPNKARLDSNFLTHVLNSSWGKAQVSSLLVGGAQQVFNTRTAADLVVPRPPLPEQRAIAWALSDVDALIGALDQVIAKKRDLKQAAMQQLLTGQRRLPGFHRGWEVKRLGELAEIISGGTPKTGEPSYWNGSIKWCTPTDITGCSAKYLVDTERAISADGLASCSAQLLPIGSLLLCSRATIGEVRIAGCEICTNQGFKSLVCMAGVSNEFLYYKLLTMKSQMIERAIGSTFLEISKKDTAALELSIPEHAEQTAIAEVLSDMDTELAALTQRRGKTRALKQGMMQELLTGRTRLV